MRDLAELDDVARRRKGIIRIYDIIFDAEARYRTDEFVSEVLKSRELRKRMSTAELHGRLGCCVREREKKLGTRCRSLIGAAWEAGVPAYTSSPGDSGLGTGLAALRLQGGSRSVSIPSWT